ncbi:MAG: hypothetical protein WC373_05680, partial [Smithella sp.]
MKFQKFEVGQPYKPGTTHYSEDTRFDFQQSGAVLELYFNRPTGDEIQDVTRGRFEIGFYDRGSVIFMLFKFGGWRWMDAPYTVHLSAPFTFEDPTPGTGYGLSIFLIDAATGILRGMRYVSLSTEFSQKFKFSVERQKEKPFIG